MFGNLTKNVSKTNARARRKSTIEIPRTVAFLTALRDNNLRLTYAALADAAEALGEHTATGLSAGQRGSKLLGGVPGALQPSICNSQGGYRKGMTWAEAPDAEIKSLRSLGYVRPEALSPFIQAFEKAEESKAQAQAQALTEGPVIEEEDDTSEG